MKLLFIRHGDPDYTIDSLTECSYTVKKQQHKLRTAYPTILYQVEQ